MTISESKIKQIIREETKRALREANIKGGTFVPRHGVDISKVRVGDRVPANMFDEPSMSPEEGPGARAAMRLREPGMRSVGDPDYLKSLRFDDENSEGAGEGETPHDPKIRRTFMNSMSADRGDDSYMGGGGGGDSESDVDPDELSDDPFYSGGYRVREQKKLKVNKAAKPEKKKIKESDNDTFVPHDFSGNKTMRWNPKVGRFEPFGIDSSGEDPRMHDPDVDYETGEVNRKRGSGDSMGSDMSESGRAAFRKIVKEETLKFLRNRR